MCSWAALYGVEPRKGSGKTAAKRDDNRGSYQQRSLEMSLMK